MPTEPADPARRVRVVRGGPVLVEGPVELVGEDGAAIRVDRFLVAICTCRRSRRYPLCDTSHRRRCRVTEVVGATEDADEPG